jgi:hypothetical protein
MESGGAKLALCDVKVHAPGWTRSPGNQHHCEQGEKTAHPTWGDKVRAMWEKEGQVWRLPLALDHIPLSQGQVLEARASAKACGGCKGPPGQQSLSQIPEPGDSVRHRLWFLLGAAKPDYAQPWQPSQVESSLPRSGTSRRNTKSVTGWAHIPDPGQLPDIEGKWHQDRVRSQLRAELSLSSLPFLPLLKQHYHYEVPMATKHESVSMRVQGLAESTPKHPQARAGGSNAHELTQATGHSQ